MNTFGRTNRTVPPVWLALAPPKTAVEGGLDALADAAIASGAILDLSANMGPFGGRIGPSDAEIMICGGQEAAQGADEKGVQSLIDAAIVQALSAIGRPYVNFFFLRYERSWEEFQISAALETLEGARQEGVIRHLGLAATGSSFAALSMWQFHDAFECLAVPSHPLRRTDYETLSPLAQERRVGLLGLNATEWQAGRDLRDLDDVWRLRNLTQSFYGLTARQVAIQVLSRKHPVTVRVRTPQEVAEAIAAPTASAPEGIDALMPLLAEGYK